jgi:glycosyltransferase involved in cell wall biosynthesis
MTTAIICGAGIVSGKEIMALELGEGLRAADRTVVYVTSLWGNGEFARRLNNLDFPFRRMRLGFISASLRADCLWMTIDQIVHWPKLILDYLRFLRQEQPTHIVHTNWHHLILLWPFLRPERDIFWVHEIVPNEPQYARFFRALSPRLRRFIAVSHAVADALREVGVPALKTEVIHNGMRDPVDTVLNGGPRDTGRINICIVGQVGPWKGHEDLIEAFASVAPWHPRAEVHIFGAHKREFTSQLVRRIKEYGLEQRVFWHGFLSDREQLYAEQDICVVPSRSEDPLPTAAIEAAFFELPVVATRTGGLPEIVIDGETGYLVDARCPPHLADRLDLLIRNAELRKQMGSAARRRAVRHFNRERLVADFMRVLE